MVDIHTWRTGFFIIINPSYLSIGASPSQTLHTALRATLNRLPGEFYSPHWLRTAEPEARGPQEASRGYWPGGMARDESDLFKWVRVP